MTDGHRTRPHRTEPLRGNSGGRTTVRSYTIQIHVQWVCPLSQKGVVYFGYSTVVTGVESTTQQSDATRQINRFARDFTLNRMFSLARGARVTPPPIRIYCALALQPAGRASTEIGIRIGLLLPVRSASFALISRIALLLLAASSFLSSSLLFQLEPFLSLGFNFAMVFALAVFFVTINRLGIAYLQYPGQARPHQFKIIDESIHT